MPTGRGPLESAPKVSDVAPGLGPRTAGIEAVSVERVHGDLNGQTRRITLVTIFHRHPGEMGMLSASGRRRDNQFSRRDVPLALAWMASCSAARQKPHVIRRLKRARSCICSGLARVG